MGNDGRFKKGWKGGPGRQPILIPEVQSLLDQNRNDLKVTIVKEVSPHVVAWIQAIIEKGVAFGDADAFKMLMELALGKLVTDPPEFAVSDEEKALLLEFRRRKKELNGPPA